MPEHEIYKHPQKLYIFLQKKFCSFDKCNNKDNINSVEVAKILWCDVLLGIFALDSI
jgi:hypothetical protein